MKILLPFVFLLAGCVTPGDLAEIRAANADASFKIQAEMQKYQSGQQTIEQAQAAIRIAQVEADSKIGDTVEKAVTRSEEAIKVAQQVAAGAVSIPEALGGSAGIASLIAIALNTYRNSTRKRELEVEALRAQAAAKV